MSDSKQDIISEFQGALMGDYRLSRRLETVGLAAAKAPGESFPKMFCTSADLEAAYRFFGNKRVSWSGILSKHRAKSFSRVRERSVALVAHDTTDFTFTCHAERNGLGRTFQKSRWNRGFLGHFSLAISSDLTRTPLGLLESKFYTRPQKRRKKKRDRSKPNGTHNESYRWLEQVIKVEQENDGNSRLIHLMDREGDSYELFDGLCDLGARFVIRVCRDRNLAESGLDVEKLFDSLNKATSVVSREVEFSSRRVARAANQRKIHPTRVKRKSELCMAAKSMTIKRSKDLHSKCRSALNLNFIHIWEKEPPEGLEPIDWKLVTTEPIDTKEQIETIVDYYRSRWLIEEFFKAIKTGCRFQQRQQESFHALLNVLATFIPVAWWLLAVRSLSRSDEKIPGKVFLSQMQLRILSAKYPEQKLDTVSDVMYAVARIGGHIKYNGPPGWQVLYRGYEELLLMEAGCELMLPLIQRDK